MGPTTKKWKSSTTAFNTTYTYTGRDGLRFPAVTAVQDQITTIGLPWEPLTIQGAHEFGTIQWFRCITSAAVNASDPFPEIYIYIQEKTQKERDATGLTHLHGHCQFQTFFCNFHILHLLALVLSF